MFALRGCRRAEIVRAIEPFLKLRSDQIHRFSHYSVLGIAQTASLEDIKDALRKKAKVIHPDTAEAADHAAWVQLLTAYQVLADPRSRQLYDLSLSPSSSPFMRKAAAAGVQHGVHEDAEIDISWNFGAAWAQQQREHQQQANASMLDTLRNDLESDFNVALRAAYLGPRLDDLLPGQFPDYYEADERSTQGTDEVLQIVSGRQLLGTVKVRRAGALTAEEKKAWIHQGSQDLKRDPALIAALEDGNESADVLTSMVHDDSSNSGGSNSWRTPGVANGSATETQRNEGSEATSRCEEAVTPEVNDIDYIYNDAKDSTMPNGKQQSPSTLAKESGAASQFFNRKMKDEQSSSQSSTSSPQSDPQILDLILGDDVIATVVGRAALPRGHSSSPSYYAAGEPKPTPNRQDLENASEVNSTRDGTATCASSTSDDSTSNYDASLAAKQSLSASRILDAAGQHTHSVIRSVTPLVRHITFVSEQVPSRSGRHKTTVGRAKRAWLPPSSVWMFKPRSYDHDIGGWFISWAGEAQKHHPAWLDPAVLTLVAALDTLDHEAAAQQPQGLFNRVREGDEMEVKEGGQWGKVKGWVRAVMRFHRGRKN